MSEIVWRPDASIIARSHTQKFMDRHGIGAYADLVARSIAEPTWFWDAVVDYLAIPFETPYRAVYDGSHGVPFGRWFVGGELNLSRACVDRWADRDPDRVAIRAAREDGARRSLTFGELRDAVARVAGWLRSVGVGTGDPVACFLPMSPEAAIVLLATARVGGLFVPIFSGFGVDAIAARVSDARPKVLVTADGVSRRGRVVPMKETADAALDRVGLPLRVAVVDYVGRSNVPWEDGRDVAWAEILAAAEPAAPVPVDSEAPFLLGYTSGTTGKPKGILLPHGGAAIKIIQEGAFQLDYQPDDVATWVTDMGWIMGPWLITAALGNGAAIALIDGAPDYPDPGALWRLVDELRITALGVSPTLVRALASHGDEHLTGASLDSLRTFGSTGEVWNPSPWWWLFETVGGGKRPIINMSGGTEVGACFLAANPHQGLKPCSVGGPCLGLAMDVFSEDGEPLRGEVGELVCKAHWPGATRGFFGDRERYLETYWSRWPDVWVHGDWATVDEDGFWFLHGRSDDTLNIAGKRIGPAEIEDAAVAHGGVAMAAAIGVPDPVKGEVIVTYVVPAPDAAAPASLLPEVEAQIVSVVGKAFRPKRILAVPDLPRTRSQKIMRRVIKALALGRAPGDLSSMENPESLDHIEPLEGVDAAS